MTNIIFDCDSTLSAIEGIDILAHQKNQSEAVSLLTNAAMNGEVPLDSVYEKRLSLIKPTLKEVTALDKHYINTLVKDAAYVVEVLLKTNINVFIVSGGLYEPIVKLAEYLGIPSDNVYAVQLCFQNNNENHAIYEGVIDTPLTTSDGKSVIVELIKQKHSGSTILIGDGSSDAVTKDSVDLFIGYGGVVKRHNVESVADVYFYQESLLPLLAFTQKKSVKQRLVEDERLEDCKQFFNANSIKNVSKHYQQIFDVFFG